MAPINGNSRVSEAAPTGNSHSGSSSTRPSLWQRFVSVVKSVACIFIRNPNNTHAIPHSSLSSAGESSRHSSTPLSSSSRQAGSSSSIGSRQSTNSDRSSAKQFSANFSDVAFKENTRLELPSAEEEKVEEQPIDWEADFNQMDDPSVDSAIELLKSSPFEDEIDQWVNGLDEQSIDPTIKESIDESVVSDLSDDCKKPYTFFSTPSYMRAPKAGVRVSSPTPSSVSVAQPSDNGSEKVSAGSANRSEKVSAGPSKRSESSPPVQSSKHSAGATTVSSMNSLDDLILKPPVRSSAPLSSPFQNLAAQVADIQPYESSPPVSRASSFNGTFAGLSDLSDANGSLASTSGSAVSGISRVDNEIRITSLINESMSRLVELPVVTSNDGLEKKQAVTPDTFRNISLKIKIHHMATYRNTNFNMASINTYLDIASVAGDSVALSVLQGADFAVVYEEFRKFCEANNLGLFNKNMESI